MRAGDCDLGALRCVQEIVNRIMEAQTSAGGGAAGVVEVAGGAPPLHLDAPVSLAGELPAAGSHQVLVLHNSTSSCHQHGRRSCEPMRYLLGRCWSW
jgi:hypothetical protein